MAKQTYTNSDGVDVEIPDGSQVVHNGDWVDTPVGRVQVVAENIPDGEIVYWRNPPAHKGTDLHPSQVANYEPAFNPTGTHRRVLGMVTDEVDIDATEKNAMDRGVPISALGSRNTPDAIAWFMLTDLYSPQFGTAQEPMSLSDASAKVERSLKILTKAGLVEQRDDGTFAVTDDGRVELAN